MRRRNGDLLEEFREWGKKKKSSNDIRNIHYYTLAEYMFKITHQRNAGIYTM